MLAGVQVGAVPPVEHHHKRPVQPADLAFYQRRQVLLLVAAEHVGAEGHDRLDVIPGGLAGHPAVGTQVLVGIVAAPPDQRPADRLWSVHDRGRPTTLSQSGNSRSAGSVTVAAARTLNPGRRYAQRTLLVFCGPSQSPQFTGRAD